jgi:hypothetical protein
MLFFYAYALVKTSGQLKAGGERAIPYLYRPPEGVGDFTHSGFRNTAKAAVPSGNNKQAVITV